MDQTIEEAAKRQNALEAAKATFFASGGAAQQIPPGVGKNSPGVVTFAKTLYGYPMSWAEQSILFAKLPAHLQTMALFKVNTGTREQGAGGLQIEVGLGDSGTGTGDQRFPHTSRLRGPA